MNPRVIKINPKNRKELDRFLGFKPELYGSKPDIKNDIQKTRKLIEISRGFEFFIVENDSGETAGTMALGVNEKLVDENGKPYGQIGMFEVIPDYNLFSYMIDFAKAYHSGKDYILFPFFMSTWHQYRFVSDKNPQFEIFLEMINKDYYPEYCKRYGTHETYRYKSSLTAGVDNVVERNREKYAKAIKNGITFRSFNKKDRKGDLKIVYDLCIESFGSNPFYADISFDDFYQYNKDTARFLDTGFATIAYNRDNKPVGFLFSTPDYTPLFCEMDMSKTINKLKFLVRRKEAGGMIAKTTAILPEYRRHSIYSSLTYIHALEAKKRGYNYIIGALVYTDNTSLKVFGDSEVEKNYELYVLRNEKKG